MAPGTSVNIGGKNFRCQYLVDVVFDDPEAVYAVICVGSGSGWKLLSVGEAATIDSPARREAWKNTCGQGGLWAGKFKMSDAGQRQQWQEEMAERFTLVS